MINETLFETSFVIGFLVNNLKYTQESSSQFNSELMVIPGVIEQFLDNNYPKQIKEILQKEPQYLNDKKLLIKDFVAQASKHVYSGATANTATKLHPKTFFTFCGEAFNLYFPIDGRGDDKNIYSVVQQYSFINKCLNGNLLVKPDVGVFINGFLVSSIQVKLQHTNQNAFSKGRDQTIGDYAETIQKCIAPFGHLTNEDKRDILKYFHAPIHLVTVDAEDGYVLRGLSAFQADFEKAYSDSKTNDIEEKKKLKKRFYQGALFSKEKHLPNQEKIKKFLTNLYSPENLQNEILYFNFIGYEREKTGRKGKVDVRGGKNATLYFPRPNQKYGVDKIIAEVTNQYNHENDSEFEIKRMVEKLDSLGVSDHVKDRAISKRKSFWNLVLC